MTLQVIGAGFGRTGTLSLKTALERVGVGPCYHMVEEMKHPEHDALWQDATDGKPTDWERLFEGYRAAVDWPVAAFRPSLAAYYLAAKIILTTRDSDSWFKSLSRTILPVLLLEPGPDDDTRPAHRHMTYSLIAEKVFEKRVDDREFILDVYHKNTQRVLKEISPERLLHYQPGDSWEPLCRFLDVEIPEEPYPHSNNTAEFREWAGFDKWSGVVLSIHHCSRGKAIPLGFGSILSANSEQIKERNVLRNEGKQTWVATRSLQKLRGATQHWLDLQY